VAVYHSRPIEDVSVVAGPQHQGVRDVEPDARLSRREAEQLVTIAYAGYHAALRFDPDTLPGGCDEDIEIAGAVIARYLVSPIESPRLIAARLDARAAKFVERAWPAIQALAKLLVAQGSVSRKEAQILVRRELAEEQLRR
jgi:hypothetical protein